MEQYRHHVLCCTWDRKPGHCGHHGGHEVLAAFKERVATDDLSSIMVTRLGCSSQHHEGAPVVVVQPDGIWYTNVKPSDVDKIIDDHLLGGRPVERLVFHRNLQPPK